MIMRKLSLCSTFKVSSVCSYFSNKKRFVNVVRSVLITLLSFLFSHLIIYDLKSISAFVSEDKLGDFEISDVYNTIANYRAVSQASETVSVVAVDDCSRQEILDVLEIVSEYSPRAIGLDVFFRIPSNDSMQVLTTLNGISNLVLPCMLQQSPEYGYERIPYSFVENHLNVLYGYVNLNASSNRDVVRDFTPSRKLVIGDSIRQIATEMAKMVSPEAYRILKQRNNDVEIIKFSSVSIPVVSARDVLEARDEDYLSRYLTNRAILIGDVENLNDMYSTPLDGLMSGVMIHAYALNTILSRAYTEISPYWLNLLLALIICFAFVLLNKIVKDLWNNVGNMIMRILQVMLIFCIVLIGSYWYRDNLQYVDFSLLVLMLGFSSLAADIDDGLYALYIQIIKRKRSKK